MSSTEEDPEGQRKSSRLLTISNFSNTIVIPSPSHSQITDRMSETRRRSYAGMQEYFDDAQGGARCCIAGEHFMTTDQVDNYFSRSASSSVGSVINVNISDVIGEDNMIATTAALKRCKVKVLNPYNRLITLIGWRRFRRDDGGFCMKLLNVIYLCFITALLLVGYVYQTFSCSGKLNVQADTVVVKERTLMPSQNVTKYTTPATLMTTEEFSHYGADLDPQRMVKQVLNVTVAPMQFMTNENQEKFQERCDHFVTTYIIPAMLHVIAFFYGVYFFRFQENEQLQSLMEKVFLQAQTAMGAQEKLIRHCRWILFLSACWLVTCLMLEILFVLSFGHAAILLPYVKMDTNTSYALSFVGIAGVMLQQCINIAILLNYVTQCEMVILYTRGICLRLQEKSQELRTTMHEILGVRDFVSLLNGALARITALCVIISCEMTVIGVCLLVLNRISLAVVYAYRILFVFVWLAAFIFPLAQAARLTKVGRRMDPISIEMKVFGYKNASELELDSFMLFVSNAKLRAKLFSVPISPGVVMGSSVVICTTLLLLFQTGVIGKHSYF